MYFYNVTVNIENDVVEDWLEWMQNHHIPNVMRTGHFLSYRLGRLLEPDSEPNTTTFIVQYELKSLEDLAIYRATAMPALQKEHQDRYHKKFIAFRSVIQML